MTHVQEHCETPRASFRKSGQLWACTCGKVWVCRSDAGYDGINWVWLQFPNATQPFIERPPARPMTGMKP